MDSMHHQDLLKYFDKVRFTWKKSGIHGKQQYCSDNHIPLLFDDSEEAVAECAEKGYPYTYNLNTQHYQHTVGHWCFFRAVDQFLLDQWYEWSRKL